MDQTHEIWVLLPGNEGYIRPAMERFTGRWRENDDGTIEIEYLMHTYGHRVLDKTVVRKNIFGRKVLRTEERCYWRLLYELLIWIPEHRIKFKRTFNCKEAKDHGKQREAE